MKVCIFGDNKSYYENKIKAELELMNVEVKIANLHDIFLHINSSIEIKHRKFDLLDFDKFLFWNLNEEYKTEIYRLAQFLKSKNKLIIDDILADKEFNEIDDLIELKRNNVDIIEFFEVLNIKTARDILIELEHPVLISAYLRKNNKKKIIISNDWTDSYDYIRTEKFSKLQLFKTDLENIIRIYVVNKEIMGALELVPKLNKPKLLYEIKKWKYHLYEVQPELKEITLKITHLINTSICYIEFIKAKDKYYVYNIKRMPKFKIISKLTKQDLSLRIAKLIMNK